jgi:hypothetical protein
VAAIDTPSEVYTRFETADRMAPRTLFFSVPTPVKGATAASTTCRTAVTNVLNLCIATTVLEGNLAKEPEDNTELATARTNKTAVEDALKAAITAFDLLPCPHYAGL